MELIRTLREKSQTRKEQYIHKQAEDLITLSDFADSLYIAFQGTPLVPVDEKWTSKEIIEELSKVRQNYINAKLQELC
jgi:hypothetical protein